MEGRYVRFVQVGKWEFCERCNAVGAVVVVAVTPEKKVLFVEQYREPVECSVIEFPAGLVGDGVGSESWASAASRELEEETGYTAESLVERVVGPPSAGLSSELVAIYTAQGVKKTGSGGGVDGENIIVHEVPITEVEQWLKQKAGSGCLIDPKIYAGLYFIS